jgi:serine/threonine-protein kinase RsbW
VAQAHTKPTAQVLPTVEVRVPADSAYVSVLRTAAAGLAARLDFTLDDIDDLRMAVDEACGLLLPQAVDDSGLTCVFVLGEDRLSVSVSAVSNDPRLPEQTGFAWAVLSAVAGSVDADIGPDETVRITIERRRQPWA